MVSYQANLGGWYGHPLMFYITYMIVDPVLGGISLLLWSVDAVLWSADRSV